MWFQMAGQMMKAAKVAANKIARGVEIALTPVTQALERLIPQGANELGQALYGKSDAYAPPGITEATLAQNAQAQAAAPQPPVQPATVAPKVSFDEQLKRDAANAPRQAAQQTRGRKA